MVLFSYDRAKAEYILFRHHNTLLENIDIAMKHSIHDYERILFLSSLVGIISSTQLFSKCNNVTKKNICDLLKYLDNEQKFLLHEIPISWGPGNHGDIDINIREHHKKHVIDDKKESQEWGKFGVKTLQEYKDYAVNNFYLMSNVIVHTDGCYVYLSGFYGNVFIVGRYDNDVFGISSSYYVESGEKPGRYKCKCFDMYF